MKVKDLIEWLQVFDQSAEVEISIDNNVREKIDKVFEEGRRDERKNLQRTVVISNFW